MIIIITWCNNQKRDYIEKGVTDHAHRHQTYPRTEYAPGQLDGAAIARALYRACSSVGRTMSTDLERRATLGPTGTSKLTPECCSSSVLPCETLEKQESTEAALSLRRSGT